MFLFLVCICADVSLDRVPHDKVDVIERNHLYDGKGELNFTQYIFWDLDFRGDYHVIAWRMEKVDGSTIRPPHKDWRSGFYHMNFLVILFLHLLVLLHLFYQLHLLQLHLN